MVKSNIPKSSAYWHFRINDLSVEQYNYLKNADVEWIIIGNVEVGDIAKGQHYHCAVKFKRSYEFARVKKMLLFNQKLIHDIHYWLEPKYEFSTIDQFINYCIKNGEQYRFGIDKEENEDLVDLPPSPTKGELAEANKKELAIKRQEHSEIGDIEWFRKYDFKFMCSAEFNRLLVWAQPDATECLEMLCNYFIYGNSGTGKSSSIEHLFPDCYRKIKNNEKWDSFFNLRKSHETVYFDELDDMDSIEKCCGGYEGLKTMAEVYPFAVRQNYGNRQLMIRPKRIIISSNYSPSQIFGTPNKYGRVMPHIDMVLKTFHRKFKVLHITEWQKLNNIKFNKETMRTEDIISNIPIIPTLEDIEKKEKAERRLMNLEDDRYWSL